MPALTKLLRYLPLLSISLFVIPVSPNYNLRELTFGQAAGGTGASASYGIEGSIGGLNSATMNGTSYSGGLGFGFTQMANVPPAPTLTNPGSYYNKLHAVISTGNNPSDTLFAIAISDDSFTTTQYVQSDQTTGAILDFADYQTYAAWGSGSGFDILGLQPSTGYDIKVKAFSGDFTESGFGPSDGATTSAPTLSFDIDVASIDSESASPYSLSIGSLLAGSVITGTNKVWIDLETNAESGGSVYLYSNGAGLVSPSTGSTLTSATTNLASAGTGYGARVDTIGQSAGGPLTAASPYDGASDNVGIINTTFRELFLTTAPITAGRGSVLLKAKASSLTPSANDYSSILTAIASASF